MKRASTPHDLTDMNARNVRVVIEGIRPAVDDGRFAAKVVAGWPTEIAADVFSDGHEVIRASVLVSDTGGLREIELTKLVNDRWSASVSFAGPGQAHFVVQGWRDLFGTWAHDTEKKVEAGQSVDVELIEARLILKATEATGDDLKALKVLRKEADGPNACDILLSEETHDLMHRIGPKGNLAQSAEQPIWVDREAAAFSAWYELFPRSLGGEGRHGTFADVEAHLDYVVSMGFDTLYFPPIHPIGKSNRKGKNNTLNALPDDVGSPYAIGSPDGGHTALHPELGTMKDFDHLVATARTRGLSIALDIALNASPDHPWIKEHPDWFEWRPDGTIKYAENPPKKYQDIVNFRYFNDDNTANMPFWEAVRDIFLFWAKHGVLIFRVDNPHTKPFPFWEWIIAEVREKHPGAIFLAEAFTRPKLMKRLAKVGYNQSYGYYTWRNTKQELTEYLTELTTEECADYMRVNFFVNTPDINPVFLQTSGRPGFRTRAILAASMAGSWGLYSGFEFCEGAPLPGKEEYLDSEKFELRHRDLNAPNNIKSDVALINWIRREQPAMRDMRNLRFFTAHDDRVLFYGRFDKASSNYILFHVLLDPYSGGTFDWELPLWELGLPDHASVEVEDLINGNRFTWQGKEHNLALDPSTRPYAIWKITPPGDAQ